MKYFFRARDKLERNSVFLAFITGAKNTLNKLGERERGRERERKRKTGKKDRKKAEKRRVMSE